MTATLPFAREPPQYCALLSTWVTPPACLTPGRVSGAEQAPISARTDAIKRSINASSAVPVGRADRTPRRMATRRSSERCSAGAEAVTASAAMGLLPGVNTTGGTGCAAGATDAVRACVSGTSASCSCRAAAAS